jgi:hypothetical protein
MPAAAGFKYLTDSDLLEIVKVSLAAVRRILKPVPAEIFHYTTAEGLIGIFDSGEIRATQAACLNDSTELSYAYREYRRRLRDHTANTSNATLQLFHGLIDNTLSEPDVEMRR